jgi:hypothetical protein
MKKGRKVSWEYGGKKYYGTEIPSMETSKAKFARTENNKIKKIIKKKK